jgi:hypothetical protein
MRGLLWCGLLCLVLAGAYAQAAEPTLITLSCDGTLTGRIGAKTPEPVQQMGVIVDLDKRTVSWLGYVAGVGNVDTANINFGGRQSVGYYNIFIRGNINRVTGHMDAVTITSDPTKKPYDPNSSIFHYDVLL